MKKIKKTVNEDVKPKESTKEEEKPRIKPDPKR